MVLYCFPKRLLKVKTFLVIEDVGQYKSFVGKEISNQERMHFLLSILLGASSVAGVAGMTIPSSKTAVEKSRTSRSLSYGQLTVVSFCLQRQRDRDINQTCLRKSRTRGLDRFTWVPAMLTVDPARPVHLVTVFNQDKL